MTISVLCALGVIFLLTHGLLLFVYPNDSQPLYFTLLLALWFGASALLTYAYTRIRLDPGVISMAVVGMIFLVQIRLRRAVA